MDYPKFVPAGNSANGFNPNEMIDLADIFDGSCNHLTCNIGLRRNASLEVVSFITKNRDPLIAPLHLIQSIMYCFPGCFTTCTDDFFPTDLDFSSFFQEVDNDPREQSNVPHTSEMQQAPQGYSGYAQNAPWMNAPELQMRENSNETMDDTDWDYLLSLGIGPSCTAEDPSGTALLRHSIANTSQAFDQQMINSELVRAAKASRKGVIMIPPLMPRSKVTPANLEQDVKGAVTLITVEGNSSTTEDVDIKSDHEGDDKGLKKRKKMKSIDPKDMTEEQLVERRCVKLTSTDYTF